MLKTEKGALEASRQHQELGDQITALSRQLSALRRQQTLITELLTEYLLQVSDPKHPQPLELGSKRHGFQLHFIYEPTPIRWKDIALTRLTADEIDALYANLPTKRELCIEPRTPPTN